MSVQDSCMVRARRTIGSDIVLEALNGSLGDKAQVEARFGPLGYSANLEPR